MTEEHFEWIKSIATSLASIALSLEAIAGNKTPGASPAITLPE